MINSLLSVKLSHWLQGLIAAIILASADAVLHYAADPTCFSTADKRAMLLHSIEFAGLIGGAAYLVKSPIPVGDGSAPAAGVTAKSLVAPFAIAALFVSGCSTTGPDPVKNARNAGLNAAGTAALKDAAKIIGTAGVQTLFSVAKIDASGGKADFVHAAAAGLWSQANNTTVSDAYEDVVNAFSAGKAAQTAAQANIVSSAALATGQDPSKVANAIAAVISTAAGAPPAK